MGLRIDLHDVRDQNKGRSSWQRPPMHRDAITKSGSDSRQSNRGTLAAGRRQRRVCHVATDHSVWHCYGPETASLLGRTVGTGFHWHSLGAYHPHLTSTGTWWVRLSPASRTPSGLPAPTKYGRERWPGSSVTRTSI